MKIYRGCPSDSPRFGYYVALNQDGYEVNQKDFPLSSEICDLSF